MKHHFLHQGGCKKWIIPTVIASVGFLIAGFVIAYDSHNAHRALTYEAAEFYNLSTPSGSPSKEGERLTSEEIGWMMDGAQAEDTPPRWINHFFNPATGQGWTGEGNAGIPSDALKLISKLALSSRDPISAKNWAKNRSAQSDYAYYEGDQTWQEAIDAYLRGDKQKAFEALGHILHLLEDMTVPDHTRNDTHAGLAGDKGSPYENWAKNYTAGKEKNLQIAETLAKAGQKPKQFPIIENYFDYNANYSSKNFFSADTIFDSTKINPNIFKEEEVGKDIFIYTNNNGDVYPVVKYLKDSGSYGLSNSILSAYWERLSKQAVISGAGAINLFFQDVEQQKKINPNPAPRQITGNLKVFSPFGELVKISNAVNNFVLGAKTIAANILPSTATTIDINELNKPQPESNDTTNDGIATPAFAGVNLQTPRNDTPAVEKSLPASLLQREGSAVPAANPSPAPNPPAQNNPSPTSLKLPTSPFPLRSLSSAGRVGLRGTSRGASPAPPAPPHPASPLKGEESATSPPAPEPRLYISRVIDGDTVTLNNGKDARLIGINSPEYGEKCFGEAKQNLENLILGKYITLEKDASETDKYGRLLRYIYLDGVMINAEMLKQGFADTMTIPPDTKFKDAFRALKDEAKFFHRGCLYKSPSSVLPLIKREDGGSADDKGPYYGGSSYAGNPGQPVPQTEKNPSPASLSHFAEASRDGLQSEEPLPETPPITTPTSTPETSATSTPEIPPIITPTSTPETATSTPPEPEPEPTPAQDKILISEIQIKGATADDEFVELYNPNNFSVSLKDWSLQYRGSESKNFSKKNFENSAAIPAYGFYLIAHPAGEQAPYGASKNYSSSTMPDMVHNSFSLSNTGGTIFLVRGQKKLETGNESTISDKVAYLTGEKTSSTTLFAETAEFSTTSTFASFERKSNTSSTAETMAAGGINETDGNAYDTDNNLNDFIFRAAPNPQNTSSTPEDPTNQHYPAPSEVEGPPEPKPEPPPEPPPPPEPEPEPPPEPIITCTASTYAAHDNNKGSVIPGLKRLPEIYANVDTILQANTTYYIDWQIYVKPKARLIIPEGVVIKFGWWRVDGSYYFPAMLRVAGSLEINGTKNNPVIFTSFRDDEHGLPIDSSGTDPAPGDWGALQIESDKNENIKIQNAKFFYGGGNTTAGIFLNNTNADIDISDVQLARNEVGIYSRGATTVLPEIINSDLKYNRSWGAILGMGSSPTAAKLVGNTLECNGVDISPQTGGGLLVRSNGKNITAENNNFLSNKNFGALYSPDAYVKDALNIPNNYWGHSSGPFHATTNPAGLGNAVSDNIIFSPFSASPASGPPL